MAKSIRLKTETQQRVEKVVVEFRTGTGIMVSDAMIVDLLVNEALDAREKKLRSKEAKR